MIIRISKKRSFSLVEVLVFVSILSIFFVIAASVATVSLKNMKASEHKLIASHYARQLEEWLRAQKEINWGGNQFSTSCLSASCNFTEQATLAGLTTYYCFNTTPISSWSTSSSSSNPCGTSYSLGGVFKRDVLFSSSPVSGYIGQINGTITVYWQEAGSTQNVTIRSIYSILE